MKADRGEAAVGMGRVPGQTMSGSMNWPSLTDLDPRGLTMNWRRLIDANGAGFAIIRDLETIADEDAPWEERLLALVLIIATLDPVTAPEASLEREGARAATRGWQAFLPEAERRVAASAAQHGSTGVVAMATRVVNTKMGHAAGRAVERAGFATTGEATEALRAFGVAIEQGGLPAGTVRDAAGHLVVPGFGKGGAVVYRQAANKLTLQTVLQWVPGLGTLVP